MWNENLKELKKITLQKEVQGRKLEINICPSILEQMNWSWESLLFPSNSDYFADVKDIDSNEIMTLITDGDIKIIDTKTKEEFSNLNGKKYQYDKIIELAKSGELDNSPFYFTENNNWFSLNFGKAVDGECTIFEDEVFEACPTNLDELINLLIDIFISYFGYKPHWVKTDDLQFTKVISETKFEVLESTDLQKEFECKDDKFHVTTMHIDISEYDITSEKFYNEYLKPYGHPIYEELNSTYLNTTNKVLAGIISKADSYNGAGERIHCESKEEVLEYMKEYMKKH